MRKLLILGIALAVMTGAALAQTTPPAPADTPTASMGMKAPPPPMPGRPGPAGLDGPDGAPPPPDGPRGHRPPPPPKAAHFRIERGDSAVDVKCADDEPMKSCADFTLQLLDKVQAMPSPSMPSSAMPAPGTTKP